MLCCVACQCGSSDKLIRTRLDFFGYRDFLSIPITKGKEKSLSVLNSIPRSDAAEMLKQYIRGCSKYAVVLGYDDDGNGRWVDLANGKAIVNNIDLKNILTYFT